MSLHGVVSCECDCNCYYQYCLCADQDATVETPQELPYHYFIIPVPGADGSCSDNPVPNQRYYNFKQYAADDNELLREGCYKFHKATDDPPTDAYRIDSNPEFNDVLTPISNCWKCLGMSCDGSGGPDLPTLRNIIQAIALVFELIVEVPEKEAEMGVGEPCCGGEDPAPIISTIPAHTITMSGCADDNGVGMCIKAQPEIECDKGKVPIHGGWIQSCMCRDFMDGICQLRRGCDASGSDVPTDCRGDYRPQGECPCEFDDRPPGLAPSLTAFQIAEHTLGDSTAVTGYFGDFTHESTKHILPNGDELPKRVTEADMVDFCPKYTCDPDEIHDDCCPSGGGGDECLPHETTEANPYTTQFPGYNKLFIRCPEEPGEADTVQFSLFHAVMVPVNCGAVCEPYSAGRFGTCTPEGFLSYFGAGASWFSGFAEDTELEFFVPIDVLNRSVCDE